jgi:hypothetical protein
MITKKTINSLSVTAFEFSYINGSITIGPELVQHNKVPSTNNIL